MDGNLIVEYVLGLVRHGLTTAGGALVTAGVATEADLATGVGAITTILGLGWSWWRKYKRARG